MIDRERQRADLAEQETLRERRRAELAEQEVELERQRADEAENALQEQVSQVELMQHMQFKARRNAIESGDAAALEAAASSQTVLATASLSDTPSSLESTSRTSQSRALSLSLSLSLSLFL